MLCADVGGRRRRANSMRLSWHEARRLASAGDPSSPAQRVALGAPRGAALWPHAPLVRADAMLSNLVKESKARRAEIAADNGEAPQHDAHAPFCA